MNGTYLSLFSGIGGLDLAVESLGFRCVGQVEWDASCQRVLERHWPDVPRWGDVATYPERAGVRSDARVREGDGRAIRPGGENVPTGPQVARAAHVEPGGGVDLIVGGFPCQPVSAAGRRKAQDDHRWLWPEFARVIRDVGPRWVLVENVAGLLSAGEPAGAALGEVLRDLAALGFDARWHCVRASDVGAPHRRERIFLLANADGEHGEPWRGWGAAGADHAGAGSSQRHGPGLHGPAEQGSSVAVADAGRHRRDAGTRLRESEPRGQRRGRPDDEGGTFAWGPYEPAIRKWERVMGEAPHPVDDRNRLAPDFVGWMMGFPPGWCEGMSRTQALKAYGNAVVPQQAALAFGWLIAELEAA